MIDRRRSVLVLAAGLLTRALVAEAQPTGKIWRIGYLGVAPARTSPESERLMSSFTQVLRDSGFVEGQNMVLERRSLGGRVEHAPALVAELIGLRVDILVIVGAAAAERAAKAATTTISIVVLNATDPVASGLVASLARPGGNITGLTDFDTDLVPKRLELLKATVPRAVRVAFIFEAEDYTGSRDAAKADALNKGYDEAARALGIGLLRIPLKTPQELASASAAIVGAHADAMLVGAGQTTYQLRKEIAELAIRQRLPAIVAHRSALTGGALMSYGPDLTENWRKGAIYVAKILNGAKPADLPVEQPTKVELIINLKTAKAIGLTIPQSLLLRADEVIQ
jgi:putative tryptophan/tyrosine transport system substrate-binding protein